MFLAIVDSGLHYFHPLQYMQTRRYLPLEHNPLVSKVPVYFHGSGSPDVLVLGSSLPMEAIARYDAQLFGQRGGDDIDNFRRYTRGRYLERLLSQHSHRAVSVFNLTCVACMVSDACQLLRKSIEAGKIPKMVIYGIGPRDFMDNLAPEAGKSAVFQVLANQRSLNDLKEMKADLSEIADFMGSAISYFYRVKADYRAMLVFSVCDALDRPADLFEARVQARATNASTSPVVPGANQSRIKSIAQVPTAKPADQFKDLSEWNERYNPANPKRFARERASFKRLQTLCRENAIQLVVVNMPLTREHKALVPAGLYSQYRTELAELGSQAGIQLIDLDCTEQFGLADFCDSAHPNGAGGKKIQDLIVAALPSTPI